MSFQYTGLHLSAFTSYQCRFYCRFFQAIFLLVLFFTSSMVNAEGVTEPVNKEHNHTTEYVGSTQCADCHQTQYKSWQGSHHDMSMRHAKPDAVLADFDNAQVEFNGKTNRFFKKGDQYWVNIEGADGQFHDYQIKYTFGFEPLQQYMVEFDDGRVQLIPFAWDSRDKAEQGQRWFYLYPEITDKHQEFYWTNTGQNWNYMCADCHSTDVDKQFDLSKNSYKTTYSEVNVGCEACHGAASKHIAWSKKDKTKNAEKKFKKDLALVSNKGFNRNLSKSVNNWVSRAGKSTLAPEKINHSQQTLVCAQCHSRHVQISDNDHVASNEFGERYMLSLIDERLYFPDGQVNEEDFVMGSFLQSKMQKNGVVCSNCHDPHSAELTLPKPALCLQCHQASTYQSKEHHNHPQDSTGAQCINCHMPETVYMQIDGRRDHRWHVPKPEFSIKLGTPDVCLSCHKDKDSSWSYEKVSSWYPIKDETKTKPFAPVFSAADQGYPNITSALSQIAQSQEYAEIIRASALSRMSTMVDANTLIAITRAIKHKDTNIRMGAINGAMAVRGVERWRLLAPLLTDKVLSIRIEAAFALVSLWQQLSAEQQKALQPALAEYMKAQAFNADRGFSHVNLGNMYSYQGKFAQAEQSYKTSIRIEPYYANAYINLADFYRQQRKEVAALTVLKKGNNTIPDNGNLAYSMGLALIRNKQRVKAIEYFEKSTRFEPNNANFYYVYGLSLESVDNKKAQIALGEAYKISHNPQHLFTLCDMQVRLKSPKARQCINTLSKVVPENVVTPLLNKVKLIN